MPIPRLLHKTLITLRQQDKVNTMYDDDAREAVQIVKKAAEKKLHGQVSFAGAGRGAKIQTYMRRGVETKAKGYVLFRFIDLDAHGIELALNDQIVQMGRMAVDYWIVMLTPEGHYADTNGATLVKAHFDDRMPARNNPGESP